MNNTIEYQVQGLSTTGSKDVLESFPTFAEASKAFFVFLQNQREWQNYSALRITRTVRVKEVSSFKGSNPTYIYRDLEVLQFSDI